MKTSVPQSYRTTRQVVADSFALEQRLKPAVLSAMPRKSKCLHEDQAFIVDAALGVLNDLPEGIADPQQNREILSIMSDVHTLAVEKCCKDCDNFDCAAREVNED